MSSGGTTTTSSNQPPAQFLNAYQNAVTQAGNVASTPFQPYTGNLVAGFAPEQTDAVNTVNSAQGVADPYINAASTAFNSATQPLWSGVQQFSPNAVSQYESPYTDAVVKATQDQFNNTNAQQAQQLTGNAVSSGAFGGDRAGVAQGVLAGQQATAQAPVIAGLYNQAYSQGLGEFNQQQQAQLGANEANSWLNSQAAFGLGNLGQEAQSTALQGASAQLQTGGLEQQLAQEQLNVPYQQFIAQQASPYQNAQWYANIAEGLGGAAGGTGTTNATSTPSILQDVTGLGVAGLGLAQLSGWLARGGEVVPHPTHPAHRGGIAANDDWEDQPQRRRAYGGGIAGPLMSGYASGGSPGVGGGIIGSAVSPELGGSISVTTPPTAHGTQTPMISFAPSMGTGVAGSLPSADQSYFSQNAASTAHAAPVVHPPNFVTPPPAAPSFNGSLQGMTGQNFSGVGGGSGGVANGRGPLGNSGQDGFTSTDIGPTARAALTAAGLIPGPVGMVASAVNLGLKGNNIAALNQNLSEAGQPTLSTGQVLGALSPVANNGYGYGDLPGSLSNLGYTSSGIPASAVSGGQMGMGSGGLGAGVGGGGIGQSNGGGGEYERGGLVRRDDGGDLPVPPIPPPDAPPSGGVAGVPGGVGSGVGEPAKPYAVNYTPPTGGDPNQVANIRSHARGLGLLAAGLGILGGKSLNGIANIGEGALQGVKTYQGEMQRADTIAEKQGEQANEGSYKKANLDLEAQRFSDAANEARSRLAQEAKYQQGELGIRGAELGVQRQRMAQELELAKTPQEIRTFNAIQKMPPEQQAAFYNAQSVQKGMLPMYTADQFRPAAAAGAAAPSAPQSPSEVPDAGMSPTAGTSATPSGRLTGDAFLQSLPPNIQPVIKAIAQGRQPLPGRITPQTEQILSLVGQYDPTFDGTDYNKRNRTAMAFAPDGAVGKVVNNANTAMSHLDELDKDFTALQNSGGIPLLNTAYNWVTNKSASNSGDPRVGRVMQDIDAAASELRKFFAGSSGGTLQELESWKENFPINGSPEQQKASVQKAIDLLTPKLQEYADQYSHGMGTQKGGVDLLSPLAQKAYARLTGAELPPSPPPTYAAPGNGSQVMALPPMQQREPGRVYQTPRGPMRWAPDGWHPEGAP